MQKQLRKIDLTSLRLFVAVCQEKSIVRAAEREFIAPSAISRRIGELEQIVGLPLIHNRVSNDRAPVTMPRKAVPKIA